jgi:hypothetical protein
MVETAAAAPMANVDTEVKRFPVEYLGLTIEELCVLDNAVCTFGLNKFEKLVLKGKFAIDRHEGSYKFLAKLRARLSKNRKREECLSFHNDSCLSDCQVVFAREGKRDSSLYGEGFI